jgi:hypothetical protein
MQTAGGALMETDRESRNRLIDCINRYLDESITAFQFDDELDSLADETGDATVRLIALELWYCYDDCKDHHVVLSKESWDYIQRLLLVLKSGKTVVEEHWRVWSWTQAAAAAGVLFFIVCLIDLGIGPHILGITAALGILASALTGRRAAPPLPTRDEMAVMPFSSVAHMLSIYRSCGFRKRRYPPQLLGRRIRSHQSDVMIAAEQYVVCIICSPLVLLWQMLPHSRHRLRVALDGGSRR